MRQEIRDDLDDICLELTDQNIKSYINYTGHGSIKIDSEFVVYSDTHLNQWVYKLVNYKDVEDVLERLKLYMNDNGYSTTIIVNYDYPGLKFSFIKRIINKFKRRFYSINVKFLNKEIDKYFDDIINLKSCDIVPGKGFSSSKKKVILNKKKRKKRGRYSPCESL